MLQTSWRRGLLLLAATVMVGGQASAWAAREVDLDVTLIERTPRYNYDAVKNNPAPGDVVTFHGHIVHWNTTTASSLTNVGYEWFIDGVSAGSGTIASFAPNTEQVVTLQWTWQSGDHYVKLVADPAGAVAEKSEKNNEIEDRTNAIIAGFWVEQTVYDYFHEHQDELVGVGSNSWEDWIQRQMAKQNELYEQAIWDISPQGVLDRVRIDKIVVVADGALPLNGGLPTNNPDLSDRTVDLMWGFPKTLIDNGFYNNTTTVSVDNVFYIEKSLVHELGHARYLIDSYGFDTHNTAHHGGYDSVQIYEGATYVGGSAYMPYLAWNEVLYYNQSGGVMSGPYNFQWSPYEAGALNRIAGNRAVCGNYNAPCNIGEYLQELPTNNHFRFVDAYDAPRVRADVRVYRCTSGPGWYGKTFDNTPDLFFLTDEDGYVNFGRNPFTDGNIVHTYGLANGVMILRVEQAGQIWYRFVEVSDFNIAYWRGDVDDAYYTMTLSGPNTGALGDLNCDGAVNAFDIDPFVQALVNQEQYALDFPACDALLADIDGDGAVNAFDIDPFVVLLVSH